MTSPVPGWTESRYKNFIISCLRGGMRRFPNKYQSLNNACVGKLLNNKTGRISKHYKCASCGNNFPSSFVQVDHIHPVRENKNWDWNEFITKLFCPVEGLQVLCKDCHKEKSNDERRQRSGRDKTSSTKTRRSRGKSSKAT